MLLLEVLLTLLIRIVYVCSLACNDFTSYVTNYKKNTQLKQ